jgi:hypothetical protein
MKADLVAYDRNGQIILIAELKKKTGVSAEWAAKWRRNMLAHGGLPDAKYFMIALPDRFYLWKEAGTVPEEKAPTFEIDAEPLLKPYMDESGISPEDISPQSFELIVAAWLNSLLQTGESPNLENDAPNWINESRFSEALSGGSLKHEVAL